jgi:hypothetical protein
MAGSQRTWAPLLSLLCDYAFPFLSYSHLVLYNHILKA